jgi:amidase
MLPNATQYGDSELEVLLYEFKASLNAYLASRSGLRVRTLADVIAFNNTHRDREMPFFGQDLLTAAETKGPLTDSAYRLALERNRRLSREEGIDLALKLHRVDVLAAPTVGPAWVTDLLNGDHFLGASAKPAATAGYPSITVPIGDASGLPVGISFFSTAWSEPLLIKLAYAFEQATQHRKAPRLLPTVGY